MFLLHDPFTFPLFTETSEKLRLPRLWPRTSETLLTIIAGRVLGPYLPDREAFNAFSVPFRSEHKTSLTLVCH